MTEERPPYLDPQSLVDLLRGLSRHEHGDFTIGDDAADEIEELRREVERLSDALDAASCVLADIQLQASIAARAAVMHIKEE